MGYRIVYSKDKHKQKIAKKLAIVAIAVVITVIAVWHVADGVQRLPEAALESMVETVQDGGTLSEAITAFCQEIIENAS